MSTETGAEPPRTGRRLYRLTIEQYLRSIEVGVFPDGPRMELLSGIMVGQWIRSVGHDFATGALGDALRRNLAEGWTVLEEKPLDLRRHSRVQPDLVIARGPRSSYRQAAPSEKETALVVEVCDSTYRLDRGWKWRIYASAGIPHYWIADLEAGQVEAYHDPAGKGKSAAYRGSAVFAREAEVPLVLDAREVGRIAVRDLLP